jgi:fatty acid-binding protein DegV
MRTLAAGEDYLFNYVKGMPIIEELAVEHATTPDAADALIERLSGIYPKERIYRSTVSPVLGTYMGPNVISVSVLEGS